MLEPFKFEENPEQSAFEHTESHSKARSRCAACSTGGEAGDGDLEEEEDWRVLALLAGLCGLTGLVAFGCEAFGWGPAWLVVLLYVLSMLAGGWDAIGDALPNLWRGRLDVHFLMLAVASGASAIGAYGEGALLLFLFSTAGALEAFAMHRTRREIEGLFHLSPKEANRLRGPQRQEERVPVDVIIAGDLLLVRPGETFPVDAVILEGESAADESSLTGEALPVDKRSGNTVSSGTQNLWGALVVRCQRPAKESSLQRVLDLIRQARQQKAPAQRLTDRFGPAYTYAVLALTASMFLVWWQVFEIAPFYNQQSGGETVYSAFYRAMTLLVVASPCALVLSIPSAILAAMAHGARRGILFRGGAAVEQLARVGTVAMDKTGTLTTGELRVVRIESFPSGSDVLVARAAVSLEQKSSHPIALALQRFARQVEIEPVPVEQFRNHSGLGLRGKIEGQEVFLGRRSWLAEQGLIDIPQDLSEPVEGLTEVFVWFGGVWGRILLEDRLRDASTEVVRQLRECGVRTVMLTGDRPESALWVGRQLQIDAVHAGLTPEGKVEQIGTLRLHGGLVAMLGDGLNDAPSLAAADVAVAMGARGSDAALEQSDVVLMNDRIELFSEAFLLSQRAKRIIQQNITISLGTIIVMVLAALGGLVPISLGVIAHEGSTVVVCLNSLRLLGSGGGKKL